MNKNLFFLLVFTFNALLPSWQDNIKWATILALPGLSLQLIEKSLPITFYDHGNDSLRDQLSFFPATFFLSACDRIIDQNPALEKYYVDIVRNGMSLLLCNILYAFKHHSRDINPKEISRINTFTSNVNNLESFLGIMPGVTSGQLARYVSLFKLVNYIFKNVLKLHVEPMHI